MDRSTALRILGLDAQQAPSDELVEGAYWRLRAHLERRVDDAASAPERAARLAELAQLRTALHGSAGAAEGEREVARAEEPRLPRWLLVWASGASALALLLALLLFFAATRSAPLPATSVAAGAAQGNVAGELPDEAAADAAVAAVAAESGETATGADGEAAGAPAVLVPGGGAAASPQGVAAGPPLEPALLVAKANLSNSRLQIARSSDRATVFEGAADATEHSLPPGRYVLSVSNPECTDRWESEVALAPGERRRVDPRNCERNGWLVVRSNVSGDSVAIDARPVGTSGTTRHPVSVGEHRILVQKKGYVPWEGVTRVAPAEEVTLRAQLFEAADASAQPASQRDASPAERDSKLSGPWHDQTERWLLGRYDRDVSGRIDTPAEVRGIECRDLLDIEGTYDRADFGIPLTRFFGFDGTGFVDGALGFDRAVRDVAYARMQACGLR